MGDRACGFDLIKVELYERIHALEADNAALTAEKADRERCGNCVAWTSSMYECDLVSVNDVHRPWSGDCFPFDRCHFPESKWELCDE